MSDMDDTATALKFATKGLDTEAEALWVERHFFPSAEDMRMVRSIALLGLLEAAQRGRYHARFRRFEVCAWRDPEPAERFTSVRVHLCVALEDRVLETTTVRECGLAIGEGD